MTAERCFGATSITAAGSRHLEPNSPATTSAQSILVAPGGTKEFGSWLLQWGDEAELLAPDTLRAELADETAKMAARYRRAPAAVQTRLPIGEP